MIQYLSKQSETSRLPLGELINPSNDAEVGLILAERLINMPAEVIPPMYKMILEEISLAVEDKEPYSFTHYLVWSKVYREVESKVDKEDHQSLKRTKRGSSASNSIFYFHPEDEILQQHAIGHITFDFNTQSDDGKPDSKRTFQDMGIMPQGYLMLFSKDGFEEAIRSISEPTHLT